MKLGDFEDIITACFFVGSSAGFWFIIIAASWLYIGNGPRAEMVLKNIGNYQFYDTYPQTLDVNDVSFYNQGEYTIVQIHKVLSFDSSTCTKSMEPTLGCSNLILSENVTNSTELKVGQIAYYEKNHELIGHQIIGYNEKDKCYIFAGTNNLFPDPECVTRDRIVGMEVVVLHTNALPGTAIISVH